MLPHHDNAYQYTLKVCHTVQNVCYLDSVAG